MEENPSRVPCKCGTHGVSKAVATGKRNHRHAADDYDGIDSSGDLMKCTNQSCQSCTAGLIADCVAVCCCPCAVVKILALAFVKVPWIIGRRCLGLGKKKRRNLEKKRKCDELYSDGIVKREEGTSTEAVSSSGFEDEQEMHKFSPRIEAENVWFYQIGHLDFGRVSFTGIQSLGKVD